jgi:hypothetical protein
MGEIDRRDFLKIGIGSLAGLAASQVLPLTNQANQGNVRASSGTTEVVNATFILDQRTISQVNTQTKRFLLPAKNASARIPAGDAYGDVAQCSAMQYKNQKSAPHPSTYTYTYLLPSPPGGRKKVALAGQATSRNMGFATGGQLWRCALVCQANLLCGLAIRE